MTPTELRAIRNVLGMDEATFARELGYNAKSDRNLATVIRKYETGKQAPIPSYIARLAYLILEHHTCEQALPDWPDMCAPNPPKEEGR